MKKHIYLFKVSNKEEETFFTRFMSKTDAAHQTREIIFHKLGVFVYVRFSHRHGLESFEGWGSNTTREKATDQAIRFAKAHNNSEIHDMEVIGKLEKLFA
jgi:hypothetical protein